MTAILGDESTLATLRSLLCSFQNPPVSRAGLPELNIIVGVRTRLARILRFGEKTMIEIYIPTQNWTLLMYFPPETSWSVQAAKLRKTCAIWASV